MSKIIDLDAVDFSERCSEEVMFLLMLSVYIMVQLLCIALIAYV